MCWQSFVLDHAGAKVVYNIGDGCASIQKLFTSYIQASGQCNLFSWNETRLVPEADGLFQRTQNGASQPVNTNTHTQCTHVNLKSPLLKQSLLASLQCVLANPDTILLFYFTLATLRR